MFCPHSLEMSVAYGPHLNHPLGQLTNRSGLPVLSACRPIEAGCRFSQLSADDQQDLAVLSCNSRRKFQRKLLWGESYTRPSYPITIKYKQEPVRIRVNKHTSPFCGDSRLYPSSLNCLLQNKVVHKKTSVQSKYLYS